ncbi:hypothetical protein CORAM0001_1369 [Corynebacterium amycolatum SK46]|nr:hypothetical protein CORAM0001_1369 [Corynebacterium amycolatum SK46]
MPEWLVLMVRTVLMRAMIGGAIGKTRVHRGHTAAQQYA